MPARKQLCSNMLAEVVAAKVRSKHTLTTHFRSNPPTHANCQHTPGRQCAAREYLRNPRRFSGTPCQHTAARSGWHEAVGPLASPWSRSSHSGCTRHATECHRVPGRAASLSPWQPVVAGFTICTGRRPSSHSHTTEQPTLPRPTHACRAKSGSRSSMICLPPMTSRSI